MSIEAKSEILSPEEVATITTPEGEATPEQPEVELPSETPDFEMPDKFKDKSPEEIAKAYMELEKMKNEKKEPEEKEEPKQPTITQEDFNKYAEEYAANGGLTEETYKTLQEKGYPKEYVDEQIEFIKYKQEKAINDVLSPYGGVDRFQEASKWAKENWTEEQVANANKQLSSGNKEVVDAVLTGLFSAYDNAQKAIPDITLHTNQKPAPEAKGYATKSDYLKDANDPRYDRDAAFRRKVEEKMAHTDLDSWY